MARYLQEIRRRGLTGTVLHLYRFGGMRVGTLVGRDSLGNEYFENKDLPYGQDRWVDYAAFSHYDASQVTPDWHAWLHHISDEVPQQRQDIPFLKPHKENKTGTADAYHPHNYLFGSHDVSTLPPTGEEWQPPVGPHGKEREVK